MREYLPRTIQELAACTCDRCKRRLTPDEPGEWQERLSFDHSCGFDSVFGDCNTVSLDLCQHCVREVLGQWLRVTPPEQEREIHALVERVNGSTEEASAALDDALSSVAESNKRIERVVGVAKLIAQVQTMVDQSGNPEGFDAARWVAQWIDRPNAALGGRRPAELMDTVAGQELVGAVLAKMQGGAYL